MTMKYSLNKSFTFATLLLLVFIPQQELYGLQVTGLYSHRVAVSNESDSERNRAFQEAFKAVIVKITGSRSWLSDPNIERAIVRAQSYVEAIRYESQNADEFLSSEIDGPENLSEKRFIEVSFSGSLIQTLLADANIPIWNSNRPSVLIWMVLQDSSGTRSLLTKESNPEISGYFLNFAQIRAIPIIFPVLDFEDRRNLSEEDVWMLDTEKITKASLRYGADSILSGRLHFTGGGDLIGLWQFIFRDEADVFDGVENNLNDYLEMPLDRITNRLANYFAVVSDSRPQDTVKLKIEGIRSLGAYTSLMNYVSGLGLVYSVKASNLDSGTLQLELDLLGEVAQLFEVIALDRDLMPIQSFQAGDRESLHYRWTR